MTSTNNMTPVLHYIKICVSFQIHWWIQTGVTVQKGSKSVIFLSRVTLKFGRWPWKTKGPLFYTKSSFVHLSKAWVNSNLSYGPETLNLGQNGWSFSCVILKFDGWPWKNKIVPLPCCIKLCASFHSHQLIQTGVTARKRPICVKINDFVLAVCPSNLADDLEKQ